MVTKVNQMSNHDLTLLDEIYMKRYIVWISYIADCCVASWHFCVCLDALQITKQWYAEIQVILLILRSKPNLNLQYLEYLPAPVLVSLVAWEVVEIEQALHGLRPQQVVSVVGLDVEVLWVGGKTLFKSPWKWTIDYLCWSRLIVEVGYFWCQKGWLSENKEHISTLTMIHNRQHQEDLHIKPGKSEVTCVGQLLCKLLMLLKWMKMMVRMMKKMRMRMKYHKKQEQRIFR